MGSVVGGLLGGGKSKSSGQNVSGFAALPSGLQNAFMRLGLGVEQFTNPNNAANVARFTPMAQTADETRAFDMMRQGFTPTQDSLRSDIAMQMNPYDDFVISEINRQSQGQNSILNQNLNAAGQFGSNRGMLGANDIDLSRLNQIGTFKQGQFNTALNNAMNVLPQLRGQDAQNLMGIGSFQRGLDYQTKQAPISALQAGTGMISPFMAGGSSTQQSTGADQGYASGLGNLLSAASAAYSFFSDIRLKEGIQYIGRKGGHKIYEFSYKGDDRRYRGVMAQDVQEYFPDAVTEIDGYLAVNYAALGLTLEEARHG